MDRKSLIVGAVIGALVVGYVLPMVKAKRAASGK